MKPGKSRIENGNQRRIRLLSEFPDDGSILSTTSETPPEDVAAFFEMCRAGNISGEPFMGDLGRIASMEGMRLTESGREYLAKLQKEESLNTSVGLLKEHRWSIYKWCLSTIGGGVVGYCLRALME